MSSQTNALASPASAALGAFRECPVLIPEDNGDSHHIPEDNGDSHHIPEDNRDSYHPTLDHSGESLVQSRRSGYIGAELYSWMRVTIQVSGAPVGFPRGGGPSACLRIAALED